MLGSYLLNTNSQNIVQCAAAQRAVSTADVLKMTQAEDGNLPFPPNCNTARTANSRVQRGRGGQSDAACGNRRLSPRHNAHRCGVAVERVERAGNVIHDFIVAAAKDSSEAAAADSRFAEIFPGERSAKPRPGRVSVLHGGDRAIRQARATP
jgi:hypothetical protein